MWLVDSARKTDVWFADPELERAALVYNQTTHALWDSRGILGGNFMQLYFTEAKASWNSAPSTHPSSSSAGQSNGASWLSLGATSIVGLVVGVTLTLLGMGFHKKPARELDGQLTQLREPTYVFDTSQTN
eukprot:COSAG05_NODE_8402_length_706_cov_22.242175_1_plen_130_part_00